MILTHLGDGLGLLGAHDDGARARRAGRSSARARGHLLSLQHGVLSCLTGVWVGATQRGCVLWSRSIGVVWKWVRRAGGRETFWLGRGGTSATARDRDPTPIALAARPLDPLATPHSSFRPFFNPHDRRDRPETLLTVLKTMLNAAKQQAARVSLVVPLALVAQTRGPRCDHTPPPRARAIQHAREERTHLPIAWIASRVRRTARATAAWNDPDAR